MEIKEVIYDISDGSRAIKALQKEYNKRHPIKYVDYWVMKNGEKIKMEDMTDSHILNAIRIISDYEDMDWVLDPNGD